MKLRLIAAGGCVALLLGACSSGASRDASPTTTTTTTTVVNPDVVPAKITAAYVDSVFRVLNHLNGDAVRALVSARKVTPTVLLYLRAIYNDPLFATEVHIAQQTLADLSNFRRPPGDRVTTVDRLIYASPACIFVATTTNFAAVVFNAGARTGSEYLRLSRKQAGAPSDLLNPTSWAMSFNADYLKPTNIPDQCAG